MDDSCWLCGLDRLVTSDWMIVGFVDLRDGVIWLDDSCWLCWLDRVACDWIIVVGFLGSSMLQLYCSEGGMTVALSVNVHYLKLVDLNLGGNANKCFFVSWKWSSSLALGKCCCSVKGIVVWGQLWNLEINMSWI